jgi:hypothetical protein
MKTKCHAIGIDLVIGNPADFDWTKGSEFAGMLV